MSSSPKSLPVVALLVGMTVLVAHNVTIYPWTIDDAFISFRYAENFSQGNGMVFNVGEKVEGYTSFLWILFLAMGEIVGLDIVVFSKILGLLFSVGSLVLLASSHRFIEGTDRKISAFATLFLGTCGVFTPWASSGMETSMFTFFAFFSILLHLKIKAGASSKKSLFLLGALCAATALARPEGLMVLSLILADQLWANLRNGRYQAVYVLVLFLVIYLPYFVWRYSYYGFLFPNTFYAKVGLSIPQVVRGAKYSIHFALTALGVVVPAVELFFSTSARPKIKGLNLLFAFVITYALYTILVGGDVFPAFRFFVVTMPVLSLLASIALCHLIRSNGALFRMAFVIVIFNLLQMRTNFWIYRVINVLDTVAEEGKEVGLWLRDNVPPDALLATNTVGSIAFYSKLRTIDMLGLTDSHIAHCKMPEFGKGASGHEKGDGDYVLSRNPDYIILGTSYGQADPEYIGDKQIYANPEFHEKYELRTHPLPSGHELVIYQRKSSNEHSSSHGSAAL